MSTRWGFLLVLALMFAASPARARSLPAASPAAKPPTALELARTRAATRPADPDAWFDLAMACARSPRLDEAGEAWRHAVALDPDYPMALIERYGAALAARPDDAEAHCRLAVGLYFRGDREAARQQLERALAIAPRDAWVLDYLGFLQLEGGHLDLAMATWQRARQADPTNPLAPYLLAQGYYRQGHLLLAKGAVAEAEKLRAASPSRP